VVVGPREFHEALPSTQDRAIALARAGAPEGTRVVAARQTEGRGRGGRAWSSPDGGLYLSMVVAPAPPPETLLPLGVGAFLARSLRERFHAPLQVKWPNDILAVPRGAPARKLGGVLVDSVVADSGGRSVIVGVGVNVRVRKGDLPESLAPRTASLDEFLIPSPSLAEVEELVAQSILGARAALSTPGGAEEVRRLCLSLLYGVGQRVTVDGVPSGTIDALSEDGALWLTSGVARQAVRAGEVRVEEAG
jgi:BirA family transcriptional regulator, biotin operon repressor / biotin---[acetyl-CoA-carboxylase] ligase